MIDQVKIRFVSFCTLHILLPFNRHIKFLFCIFFSIRTQLQRAILGNLWLWNITHTNKIPFNTEKTSAKAKTNHWPLTDNILSNNGDELLFLVIVITLG